MPTDIELFSSAKPVYIEMDGWQKDTAACRSFSELPAAALKYITKLQELVGVKVTMVSTGPDRAQAMHRDV